MTEITTDAIRRRVKFEIEGRELKLSNLRKVIYPETGFTKGELIDYYTSIATVLLPQESSQATQGLQAIPARRGAAVGDLAEE